MSVGLFGLDGRCAVVTGGTGALGGAIAGGLAAAGARVGVLARSADETARVAATIQATGGQALAVSADVLELRELEVARELVLRAWGRIDILVNVAGGNLVAATVAPGGSFLDLDANAFRDVVDLNLLGSLLPIQVFGRPMVEAGAGSIVNISSLAASRPLTRVAGYGASKAAVENLTRWLAVHVAQQFGPGLRVNAVAPGFFLGEQNRELLVDKDGSLTARGESIVAHTPMGRFGEPSDVIGPVVWLASDASRFVTGTVIPVDGGFSAFGGV